MVRPAAAHSNARGAGDTAVTAPARCIAERASPRRGDRDSDDHDRRRRRVRLRRADEPDSRDRLEDSLRGWIEWIAVAAGAVIVALLIRAFVLQAFYIPSESMEPTLHKNDRIMVNKLSYHLHDVRRAISRVPAPAQHGVE